MTKALLVFLLVLGMGVFPFYSIANAVEEVTSVPKEIVNSPLVREMGIALKAAKEAGALLLSLRQEIINQISLSCVQGLFTQ